MNDEQKQKVAYKIENKTFNQWYTEDGFLLYAIVFNLHLFIQNREMGTDFQRNRIFVLEGTGASYRRVYQLGFT